MKREARRPPWGPQQAVRSLLACFAALGTALSLGACQRGREPLVQPQIVDLAQLEAAIKRGLGRGTLINVWATW